MTNEAFRPVFARRLRVVAALAFLALLIAANGLFGVGQENGAERAPARSAEQGIAGRTEPSKEMDLAFPLLAQVAEALIKEGDKVEAGQVLLRQDTAADMARLAGLEAKADVAVLVKLAEAQRDLANVELDMARAGVPAVRPIEVRQAELEVEVAETRIKEQTRQGQIDQYAADEQKVMIDYKTLRSPVSGFVEKLDAAVGEVFGPQTPAVRIVTTDPLHVEVLIAEAARVMRLSIGDVVQVRYEGEEQWRDAKVVFISPVGDAGRLPFKAELPNPEGRPAGLPVQVRLPS